MAVQKGVSSEEEAPMPKIDISDETFARLQKLARPLIDSSEDVIVGLLNDRDGKPDADEAAASLGSSQVVAVPNLTHTKPLALSFNGVDLIKPAWKDLLVAAIYAAHRAAQKPGDLKRYLIIPHMKGKKVDQGYRYLPDIDLSYQGQDANTAWKAAHHVATQLGLSIVAEFVWHQKEGAAHPGEVRRLAVNERPKAA
jgi:hypothetical protein